MLEAMEGTGGACEALRRTRMSTGGGSGLEAVHEELRVLSYAQSGRFHEVKEAVSQHDHAGCRTAYIAN